MIFQLEKMPVSWDEATGEVRYFTPDKSILLNDWLGKEISLQYTGRIFCRKCAKQTKNSFGEGFCYTCFSTAPEASPCIINPELCEAHLGKGRDIAYEEKNHNQPHYVYLAATDVVKVGVTRTTQVPTRWIDQGAASAIILAETPYRQLAGEIEVALKDFFTDKTNWQSMLKNIQGDSIDLEEEKWRIAEELPSDISNFWIENDRIYSFNYPVLKYPEKVSSKTFDKEPLVKGILTGIRGQYLQLDEKNVINLRRHTGYEIDLQVHE